MYVDIVILCMNRYRCIYISTTYLSTIYIKASLVISRESKNKKDPYSSMSTNTHTHTDFTRIYIYNI